MFTPVNANNARIEKMDKEELRALYRQIRIRMSSSEVSSKSRMIGRKLLNEIDWTAYKSICVYMPIDGLHEIDIRPVASKLETRGKDVGSVSTSQEARLPDEAFDVILVPCLAFDARRYRLGWGGGWYDRFLARQPHALKIGLAYQDSFVKSLPNEPHDIQLDKIITDKRTY
jgi:5-formyltetrahydrofolate cyclo-ligase